MSYYLHHVPGRMRVKIPLLKNSPATASELQQHLQELDGIEQVLVNTVTGSVLIYYNRDTVGSDQLIQVFKDLDYFDESKAISHDNYIRDAVSKTTLKIGKAVFGWAVGKTLEDKGLALLAALI